jgi:hypothetical protein
VSGIVGGLFQIILLMEVFEIKLDNAVLKRGERGPPAVAEGVSQKHEIADNAVGNHGSIQKKVPMAFNVYLLTRPVKILFLK